MQLSNAGVYYNHIATADEGGGPIRRSPLVAMRYPMSLINPPQMVQRTPMGQPEIHPGDAVKTELWQKKFLPDGRLVDINALGGAFGAGETLSLGRPIAAVVGAGLIAGLGFWLLRKV